MQLLLKARKFSSKSLSYQGCLPGIFKQLMDDGACKLSGQKQLWLEWAHYNSKCIWQYTPVVLWLLGVWTLLTMTDLSISWRISCNCRLQQYRTVRLVFTVTNLMRYQKLAQRVMDSRCHWGYSENDKVAECGVLMIADRNKNWVLISFQRTNAREWVITKQKQWIFFLFTKPIWLGPLTEFIASLHQILEKN